MKKYIIYIIIVSLFTTSFISVNAQRSLRYKDVYKITKTKSKEEAYMALKEFQYLNPLHANAYFQLAKITQYYSKQFDPLLYPNLVSYFTYETNNYYGLAKHYINEKEIRRNREYYEGVPILDGAKKLSLIDVQQYIDKNIEENKEYERNFKLITHFFQRAAYFYENCIQNFRNINLSQTKIKDIYLMADNNLMRKLDTLKSDFDSTLYFITEYQNALTNYPIKNYHPEYSLKDINTYRLEGLTNVSFLYNQFYIWNFGKWIKDFKFILENEISPLRKEIELANKKLNIALNTLLKLNTHSDSLKFYSTSNSLLNKISKYDFDSPVVTLFKYKKSKEDFLISYHISLLDIDFNNQDLKQTQQAKTLDKLIDNYAEMQKQLKITENKSSIKAINKYKIFFDKNYKGSSHLKNHFQKEKDENNNYLQKALSNYHTIFERYNNRFFYQNKYASFNSDSIALFNNQTDSLAKFISQNFLKWKNTQIVSGYINSNNKNTKVGFVSAIYKDKAVWTRSIKSNTKTNISVPATILGENKIYVVGQSNTKSSFLSYDGSGNETVLFEKDSLKTILKLNYDDIAQNFTVISGKKDSLQIQKLNILGENIWENPLRLNFTGKYINLLKFGDKYILILNAQGRFKISDKNIDFQKGTKQEISLIIFNDKRELVKIKALELGQNAQAIYSVKLNSAYFNITGHYGEADSKQSRKFYLLLDSELNSIKNY